MKDQTVLGRVKHLRHEKYIEIAPDAFLRDTDRASFLGTLCNFLSPEKLDPAKQEYIRIVAKATEQSLLDRFQSAEDMELSLNGASNIS